MVWTADALFELSGNDGRAAAGDGHGQVLKSQEVTKCIAELKRKVNPPRVSIEGTERMRWLANLRRSTGAGRRAGTL